METSFFNLAKQFIMNPKMAWEGVKDESADAQKHIVSYVLPLALIPAVATLIGTGIIGYSVLGYRVHSLSYGISGAVISLLTTILGVLITGFVVQKLSSNFNTSVTFDKAVQLVGFSYTPVLVAGIFNIYPALSFVILIAGIYSLYVLYLGFKPMTNVPEQNSTGYFLTTILVTIVVYLVLGVILTAITTSIGFGVHPVL